MYGSRPIGRNQLIDGDFVNGLSWGDNVVFQNGLTAVGTNQATSLQLGTEIAIFEIDTSTASTGVAMPPALAGNNLFVINNTANNITIYPSIVNNAKTSAQDTFNNAATSFTLNAHTGTGFTCGKNGLWFTN